MSNPLIESSPAPANPSPSGAGAGAADPSPAAPAADPAASSASAAAAGQDQPNQRQTNGATEWRPKGLPDHLAGKDATESLGKLFEAYSGLREKLSRGEAEAAPKDASAYVFEPVEAVKPWARSLADDPMMAKAREIAHASGMSQKAFNGFLNGIFAHMAEAGMVEPPFNADRERAALLPDISDPAERSREASRLVTENIATVRALREQGMPEDAATWLEAQLDRAAPNKALAFLAQKLADPGARPALGGQPGSAVTQADLDARIRDPRNNVGHRKYEPAFAAETTRLFQQLYGSGARA